MKMPPLFTMFTDAEGKSFSWARCTCSVMVGFAMAWGTSIVTLERKIPDFTSVALLIGAVYGVNRVGEAFGKSQEPPPPATKSTQ